MQVSIAEILELENAVWQALVSGDAKVDAKLLDDSFLGVYETGFSNKAGHVDQLAHGPTVVSYALSDTRLIIPGKGLALLCYLARFKRHRSDAFEKMYVSSLWRRESNGWQNIFSQDTPTGDQTPV